MKKTLIILLVALALTFTHEIQAQSLDEKVQQLMVADGTMNNIENLIKETINYQKQMNSRISEGFWRSLNIELQKKAIPDFVELVSPIYKKSFSEQQIDELINFYTSEIGKELVAKQPEILAELNMPIMQWSQNVNAQIIDKIENRGNEMATSNEIEQFEQDFKNKYGLQIINLSDLKLDKEHNPGTLLIDFGETDGSQNITKRLIVKNNTDSLLSFEQPLFLSDNDIIFDWGDQPLKPKEERALKFILNVEEAEGSGYSLVRIQFNQEGGFPIGIEYNLPQKQLKYTISKDSLSFEDFTSHFSKEYEFEISNTGTKSFRIGAIELDKSIAYVYFDRDMIAPQESSIIKVLFTKELISAIEKVELNLKIKLSKSQDRRGPFFPHKTIKVKIE